MSAPKKVVFAEELVDTIDEIAEVCAGFSFVGEADATGNELIGMIGPGRTPSFVSNLRALLVLGEGHSDAGKIVVTDSSFRAAPSSWVEALWCLGEANTRNRELSLRAEMLNDVERLMSIADLEDIFREVGTIALEILGLERGRLLIYDASEERYVPVWSNDGGEESNGSLLPGVPVQALEAALEGNTDWSLSEDRSLLVVPLRSDEDPIGVFAAWTGGGDVSPARADRVSRWIGIVTLILSSAYHMTRSNELALKDDLTRAFNRRFLETYLSQEFQRGTRYGTIFSIIFLDLDDLKGVNDRHGHMSGSRTLQEVAKRILSAVRGIDRVVRFGGDEFCIILPQTDEDAAQAVAERVRNAIAAEPLKVGEGIEVSMTASFGIASFPQHGRTKEELLRRADDAMYRVKAASKNGIGVAAME